MKTRRFGKVLMAVIVLAILAACGEKVDVEAEKAAAEVKAKAVAVAKAAEAALKAKEAEETAIDAYGYAYPLVTMELTRRALTNVASAGDEYAPMGQFARHREYPAIDNHAVTAPNADTLYTLAWFDVSREPWIVSVPDMKGRYYLLPMLDGWTNVFADPGKRTTGTKAQQFAITGPGWSGELPKGVTEYKSGTGLVWLLGRIYCTGAPQDYKAVHALQDKFTAVPLSSYGKPYTPEAGAVDANVDPKAAVRDLVNAMDAASYFKLFAELLKTNPPTVDDAPMVEKLAKIGIVPGQDFDITKLDAAVAKGVKESVKPAQEKILRWKEESIVAGDMKLENGWLYSTKMGQYGTNYRQRAMVTWIGLGANRPEDAVYPMSQGPDILKKYSGANKYVLHFNKGEMPPVDGFWSLTMYDANFFFVPNDLKRYTVSQRDKLKKNADGLVDIYIQHESPGKGKESNWLPAPAEEFTMILRLYWPKEKPPSVLDGSWKLPEVKEAS